MRSTLLLSAFAASLAAASSTPYNVTHYVSDTISGWSYYSFTIAYTPPAGSNLASSEPAFSTYCYWDTDEAAGMIACTDTSVSTEGEFSSGSNELVVMHCEFTC